MVVVRVKWPIFNFRGSNRIFRMGMDEAKHFKYVMDIDIDAVRDVFGVTWPFKILKITHSISETVQDSSSSSSSSLLNFVVVRPNSTIGSTIKYTK